MYSRLSLAVKHIQGDPIDNKYRVLNMGANQIAIKLTKFGGRKSRHAKNNQAPQRIKCDDAAHLF
jgi:hypothetical protein